MQTPLSGWFGSTRQQMLARQEMARELLLTRQPRATLQQRLGSVSYWVWYGLAVVLTVALLAIIVVSGPNLAMIAWLAYFAGIVLILIKPRYGLYLTVFLTLAADTILVPAYPFVKNFTSAESLFHMANRSLIFSPLETYLVLTLFSWLVRAIRNRVLTGRWSLNVRGGPLFGPVAFFTLFVLTGLAWGLVHKGNVNIALWEVRPILYVPLMFVLTSNLIRTRAHVNRVIWLAMAGLLIVAVIGIASAANAGSRLNGRLEWVIEHGSAVRLNTLFVLLIASFVYRASRAKRIVLSLMAPFALFTYAVAQRRAAMLALALALGLTLILLAQQNRRLFWRIAPPIVMISFFYLAAFWNSSGTLGLPARAIRSALSYSSGNVQEDASTFYRLIENMNISYTLRQAPLTGVGFGQQFHIIAPMPDISYFEWWQYITHNSIVWFWMETGALGFFCMVFLIGAVLIRGVQVVRAINEWRKSKEWAASNEWRDMSAIALTAVLYVAMHFTYAYVDMAWDIQSMVYLGLMIGLINSLPAIIRPTAPAASDARGAAPSRDDVPAEGGI